MNQKNNLHENNETQEYTGANYDFDSIKRIPFYFGSKDKPLLGWIHTTDQKQYSDTGIIICPPLAIEYMNSYRSLRYIADYFALAGIPAIRFDYHGTGDSSGNEENENQLNNWLQSIEQANEQLKKLTNCSKLGLFGFRMGATLAALVAKELQVEFLILWAALTNGKKFIRETKLIQMTSKIQTGNVNTALLEAGGMRYSAQTIEDINSIDLTKITPKAKHILIVSRDEQISDHELLDSWNKKKLHVKQENYFGSSLMLIDAHHSVVPHQSIQSIVQWVTIIKINNAISNKIKTNKLKLYSSTQMSHYSINKGFTQKNNALVSESIFFYGSDKKNIAILTESDKSKASNLPTVIIANSGANHRVGPSRIYVLIARELSLLGFRCLRIDVPGIGDSIVSNQKQENIEYITSSSDRILDIIKTLKPQSDNNQFILMGLCSGAYFSFHAALDLVEINIIENILINPLTFYWDECISETNSSTKHFRIWNWYKKALTSPDSWTKLFKGKIDYKSLLRAIKNRLKVKLMYKLRSGSQHRKINIDKHRLQLGFDLVKITNNNTHIQFILSRSDPGYDILMTNAGKIVKKLKKEKKINISFIEDADHTFSKYKPRCDVINTVIQLFNDRYF